MNKLGIWAIAIATAFAVLSANQVAIAEVDLTPIDVKILDVQMEEFETGYRKTSDLVKIELIFQNNGDSYYTLKAASNQLILILTPPYSSAEELIEDTGRSVLDVFVQVSSENFEIEYSDYAEIANGCQKTNFSLRTGESKRITICYVIPLSGVPSTTERIERDQLYLRLVTVPHGSSCPNCKMISLKDVAEIPSELETIKEVAESPSEPETKSQSESPSKPETKSQ